MICNKDCFHCTFSDCIYDGMDLDDYREAAERDRDLKDSEKSHKQKMIAAKKKAYREANRDEIAAKKKAYYEANRDEIAAYQKAYYEANRDEIAAKKKAYREANRDEIAAYQKAYYEANRDENRLLGSLLQKCRKAVGLPQWAVAERLGVSRQQVCHFETGRAKGDMAAYMNALHQLSGVSVEFILQEGAALNDVGD